MTVLRVWPFPVTLLRAAIIQWYAVEGFILNVFPNPVSECAVLADPPSILTDGMSLGVRLGASLALDFSARACYCALASADRVLRRPVHIHFVIAAWSEKQAQSQSPL